MGNKERGSLPERKGGKEGETREHFQTCPLESSKQLSIISTPNALGGFSVAFVIECLLGLAVVGEEIFKEGME